MIAGLLLAAGAGRRLGGRPKALLPYRGGLLVEHAAQTLVAGGCDRVYVVHGAADVPNRPEWTKVHNPFWESGMGSSLRMGLMAIDSSATAVVVLLVDQPGIGPAAVNRLIAANRDGSNLVVATYGGARSHPVLFGRSYWDAVAASAIGDAGARNFLQEHATAITTVECGDIADPADIDLPEDLPLITTPDG
ncbi:MAG TPA: 4-diphosphocytidyl-2C-methyl-D-erythritol synthase [Micromonosporaceae bacterium]|nr:4-diphosphocytidyl-2C-methyl-D-erythritol synthase [Micromonosporaceae bacterium]